MVSCREFVRCKMSSLMTLAETAKHRVSDVCERSVHFDSGLSTTPRLPFGRQLQVSRRKDSVGQRQTTLPIVHAKQSIDPATLDIRTLTECLVFGGLPTPSRRSGAPRGPGGTIQGSDSANLGIVRSPVVCLLLLLVRLSPQVSPETPFVGMPPLGSVPMRR